jgi:hypothetical protein
VLEHNLAESAIVVDADYSAIRALRSSASRCAPAITVLPAAGEMRVLGTWQGETPIPAGARFQSGVSVGRRSHCFGDDGRLFSVGAVRIGQTLLGEDDERRAGVGVFDNVGAVRRGNHEDSIEAAAAIPAMLAGAWSKKRHISSVFRPGSADLAVRLPAETG